MTKIHSDKVIEHIKKLGKQENRLLELAKEINLNHIYPLDFFINGTIDRTLKTSKGVKLLIETFSMTCTRTLLRAHIDTALRLHAASIVGDSDGFVMRVMKGEQINRMEDANGNKLSDAYLVSELSHEHPWLSKVYKNLSGYIHYSGSHIFNTARNIDDKTRTIEISISPEDIKYPESSWVEIIDCFSAVTDILIGYLEGWIFTKSNLK